MNSSQKYITGTGQILQTQQMGELCDNSLHPFVFKRLIFQTKKRQFYQCW
jgi:hypothetical protein